MTPDVRKMPSSPERTKRFLDRCYEKLPFALPSEKAQKQIVERTEKFADAIFRETGDEIVTAKRKIR